MKTLLKNLSFSFLTLLIFFACAEGFSRFYAVKKHRLNEFADLIEQQGVTAGNKKAGEVRVFIIGESAARGVPYSMDSSFSGFLQKLFIENGHPEVKIVNTGIPGRHSFYHREEASTLIHYKADAVIFYAGNNDTRDFSNVMRDVPFALLDFNLTWHSAFYASLKRKMTALKQAAGRPVNFNQDDVWHWTDTYLNKKRSYLENPEQGLARKELALEDYRRNLNSLAGELKRSNIRVFVTQLPIVHEALPSAGDYPRKGFTFAMKPHFKNHEQAQRWKLLLVEGLRHMKQKQYALALNSFEKAVEINAQYPFLFHNMGDCYKSLGKFPEAREMYEKGKAAQIQSPGGDPQKNRILKEIAETYAFPLISPQEAFEQVSPDGIVGRDLFLDHCHPNITGHKVLASAVMQGLCREKLSGCVEKPWQDYYEQLSGKVDNQNLARENLLTAFYFLNGTAWQPEPDYKEALFYLEKAKPFMPDNPDIHSFLAAAYWNTGDKVRAGESLEILKRFHPDKYRQTLQNYPYLDPKRASA